MRPSPHMPAGRMHRHRAGLISLMACVRRRRARRRRGGAGAATLFSFSCARQSQFIPHEPRIPKFTPYRQVVVLTCTGRRRFPRPPKYLCRKRGDVSASAAQFAYGPRLAEAGRSWGSLGRPRLELRLDEAFRTNLPTGLLLTEQCAVLGDDTGACAPRVLPAAGRYRGR